MILFKNILARILKNNLDFFFKIIFQDYFAKILKNNLENMARSRRAGGVGGAEAPPTTEIFLPENAFNLVKAAVHDSKCLQDA